MAILVPDWRIRLQISISGGCAGRTNVKYDNQGNPIQPGPPFTDMQVYTGAFSDPNGHITPADPTKGAIYYLDSEVVIDEWRWSVANQNWFQVVG